MDPELFPEGKCRLLLVGKTGNGKSSTGNSILRCSAFVPQVGINSATQNGDLRSGDYGGVELQVMDTPGLHDTEAHDRVIIDRITRSLMAISPGPHAVILCLSCDQRFTQEENNVVQTLKHAFGKHLMSVFVVVMVKRDQLEKHNVHFEDQLEKCIKLKELMAEVDNRYVLFDNRAELEESEKEEQLQCLLHKVMEVVRANNGLPYRIREAVLMRTSLERMVEKELEATPQDPTRTPYASKEAPAYGSTAQTGNSQAPPKPPRREPDQRAERELDDQPHGTSENRAAEMSQDEHSAPSSPFEYTIPDRPGMSFRDKQAMVEAYLRRMLAQGRELSAEQEKEVEKVSQSLLQKVREGMKKFAVEKLSVCRLM